MYIGNIHLLWSYITSRGFASQGYIWPLEVNISNIHISKCGYCPNLNKTEHVQPKRASCNSEFLFTNNSKNHPLVRNYSGYQILLLYRVRKCYFHPHTGLKSHPMMRLQRRVIQRWNGNFSDFFGIFLKIA